MIFVTMLYAPVLCLLLLSGNASASALNSLEQAVSAQPDNLKLGSDYRQAAIQEGQFNRSIEFFKKLVDLHPGSANAYLNLGFAYVDKIPVSGMFSQLKLGKDAIAAMSKSLDLKPKWIGYYARAQVSLYFPKVFGKAKSALADLENALALQSKRAEEPYYVKTYVSLGDAEWKLENLDRAQAIWKEGLLKFPQDPALTSRLNTSGKDLERLIDDELDRNKRANTDLSPLREN